MAKNTHVSLVPGGVEEYIKKYPKEVQRKLNIIRRAIRQVAPGSIETVSYFGIPGYSYEGYDYNGMFTWFSYKEPNIRLHLRPPVIQNNEKELTGFVKTKSILSFPESGDIPLVLVKKLVIESLKKMKTNSIT